MEEDNKSIKGAESILIHNGNIVLGMQTPGRWYTLEDGTKAGIIKTIGGKIEIEDSSSREALQREISEEIEGINEENLRISTKPVFSKNIKLGDLNPFQKDSKLSLTADFYVAGIIKEGILKPNDLPAILEIPIEQFIKMKFGCKDYLRFLNKYITKNEKIYQDINLPESYALMIPREISIFFKNYQKMMKDEFRVKLLTG